MLITAKPSTHPDGLGVSEARLQEGLDRILDRPELHGYPTTALVFDRTTDRMVHVNWRTERHSRELRRIALAVAQASTYARVTG